MSLDVKNEYVEYLKRTYGGIWNQLPKKNYFEFGVVKEKDGPNYILDSVWDIKNLGGQNYDKDGYIYIPMGIWGECIDVVSKLYNKIYLCYMFSDKEFYRYEYNSEDKVQSVSFKFEGTSIRSELAIRIDAAKFIKDEIIAEKKVALTEFGL